MNKISVRCTSIDHHQRYEAGTVIDSWCVRFVSNPGVAYFYDQLQIVYNEKPEFEVGSQYELQLSKLA